DGTDTNRNPWSASLSSPWVGGSKGVPSEIYALLSLGATNRTSEYGTAGWAEKYYDLVHYPVSVTARTLEHSGVGGSRSRQSGYCPSVFFLPVGHYQWIFGATTTNPVGSPPYKPSLPYSTPNELAFRATMYRGTEVMSNRYVTRAVIG